MAKKIRRASAGAKRPPRPEASEEKPSAAVEAETDEETEASAAVLVRPTVPGPSPLLRSQEIQLEIGLGLIAALVGGLSGFGDVPMLAATGNPVVAAEGAVVGACLGYSLGRTLFMSVRSQWILWIAIIGLTYGGGHVAGPPGAVLGAIVGALIVVFGPLSREGVEPSGLSVREFVKRPSPHHPAAPSIQEAPSPDATSASPPVEGKMLPPPAHTPDVNVPGYSPGPSRLEDTDR